MSRLWDSIPIHVRQILQGLGAGKYLYIPKPELAPEENQIRLQHYQNLTVYDFTEDESVQQIAMDRRISKARVRLIIGLRC